MRVVRIGIVVLAFVAFAGVVAMIVAFGGKETGADTTASRRCSDTAMAYIMSRKFVERQLAAPSTAKFPSFHSNGVHVSQAGECKFRVVAYVDAQNGLGAIVRTRYTIDMEYFPDSKSWLGRNLGM